MAVELDLSPAFSRYGPCDRASVKADSVRDSLKTKDQQELESLLSGRVAINVRPLPLCTSRCSLLASTSQAYLMCQLWADCIVGASTVVRLFSCSLAAGEERCPREVSWTNPSIFSLPVPPDTPSSHSHQVTHKACMVMSWVTGEDLRTMEPEWTARKLEALKVSKKEGGKPWSW